MGWAKHQPKDGDLILVCCHSGDVPFHWFVLDMSPDGEPLPMGFNRPNGSRGAAKWACICDDCIRRDPDPQAHIRGERYWTGDEPVIQSQDVERTQSDVPPEPPEAKA